MRRVVGGTLGGSVIGAIAGLSFAIEALLRNPGIQGIRDRGVVLLFFPSFYLLPGAVAGLAAGLAVALLLFALPASVGRGFLRRGAPVGSGAAAAFFAFLEGFGRWYECRLWHSKNFQSLTVGPVESFLRFLALIGIAILIGAAVGLLFHAILRWAERVPSPARRAAWLLAIVSVCVAAPMLLAAVRKTPAFSPPHYDASLVRPASFRVQLIVMDGADWDFLMPVLEEGKMPNLEALMKRGVSGELGATPPSLSPHMWTVLSTGLDDDANGLCEFFAYRPPGGRGLITRYPGVGNNKRFMFQKIVPRLSGLGVGKAVYASALQKRVPEIWTYLSDAGKRVAVAGWRYSMPASPVNGAFLSDRFGPVDLPWQVCYPEDLDDRLRRDFTPEADSCLRRIFGDMIADDSGIRPGRLREKVRKMRYEFERDIRFATLGRSLADSLDADFTAVGLTSVDATCHECILEYLLGRSPNRPPLSSYLGRFTTEREIDALAGAIDSTFVHWDDLLGMLLRDAGDDLVVVVSDHGHDLDGSGHRFGPKAIVVLAGGPVRAGSKLEAPMNFDIAPTILHVAGLPVPEGLRGRVLEEAFDPEWAERNPVRFVKGGEASAAPPSEVEQPELRQEDLKDLKALGYVD